METEITFDETMTLEKEITMTPEQVHDAERLREFVASATTEEVTELL